MLTFKCKQLAFYQSTFTGYLMVMRSLFSIALFIFYIKNKNNNNQNPSNYGNQRKKIDYRC